MKRKAKGIIILLALFVLVFSTGAAVYADTAAPANTAVLTLPGTDLVGSGTRPVQDPENETTDNVQNAENTDNVGNTGSTVSSDVPAQPADTQSGGSIGLASGADTADIDIGEVTLYSALMAAGILMAIVALRWMSIEKARIANSEKHDREMDEFRKTCRSARKMYADI